MHPERLSSCLVVLCSVFLLVACSGKLHVLCARRWVLYFSHVGLCSTSHRNTPCSLCGHVSDIEHDSPPGSSSCRKTRKEGKRSNPRGLFVVFNALKMFAGRSIDVAIYVHMTCKRERLGRPRSHCEGSWAMEQVAQGGCAAPFWGFFPYQTG